MPTINDKVDLSQLSGEALRLLLVPLEKQLQDFAIQKANSSESFELRPINPVHLLVAYSGGRDSTALLDVVSKLFHRKGQCLIGSVTAIHVHHGLSKNADAWADSCRQFCEEIHIPIIVQEVYVNRNTGLGPEAAAREARYKAFREVANDLNSSVLLTAHHLDDRLETFLMAWMRGAGVDGLSSIAQNRPLEGTGATVIRPWLNVSRERINQYVNLFGLHYVEDESNTDTSFLRNLIRNDIFPVLDKARDGWRQSACRSIELVHEASDLMLDLAKKDLAECLVAEDERRLDIKKFIGFPRHRQALILRLFLTEAGIRKPSRVKLLDAIRQISESRADGNLLIRFGHKEVRRWNHTLVVCNAEVIKRRTPLDMRLEWNGEKELSLGLWGGVLRFERCAETEEGFDADLLRKGPLYVRSRKGGETIKLFPLRPSRNLKYYYQDRKISSFERTQLPLIWLGETLIYAAGLGAEVRAMVDSDTAPDRVKLVWIPDGSLFSV